MAGKAKGPKKPKLDEVTLWERKRERKKAYKKRKRERDRKEKEAARLKKQAVLMSTSEGDLVLGAVTDFSTKAAIELSIVEQNYQNRMDYLASLPRNIFDSALIMSDVIKHLLPKHRMELRETCKVWNKVMIPEIRKTHTPIKLHGFSKLEGYIDVISKSVNVPFAKYSIKISDNKYGDENINDLTWMSNWMWHLLSLGGSFITKLNLDLNGRIVNIPDVCAVVFKNSNSLTELEVNNFYYHSWSEHAGAKQTFQEMPSLKKLSISKMPRNNGFVPNMVNCASGLEYFEMKQSIGTSAALNTYTEHLDRLKLLKVLKIEDSEDLINWSQLVEFSKKNQLELNTFETSLCTFHAREPWSEEQLRRAQNRADKLSEFLQLQASHLHELVITIRSVGVATQIAEFIVPSMRKLDTLTVKLRNNISIRVKFERNHMVHIPIFPKLKKLVYLDESRAKDIWFANMTVFGVHNITEFHGLVNDSHRLANLERILPFLKKLKIKCPIEVLADLWRKWPKLECLHVELDAYDLPYANLDLDSALTGLSKEGIKYLRTLQRVGYTYNSYWDVEAWATKEFKAKPGISNMKHLREFKLEFRYTCENTCVTDISGYYEFARPNTKLRTLIIPLRAGISGPCKEAIKRALGPNSEIILKQFNWSV